MSPPPAQAALPMNALTLLRSPEGLTRLYHDLGYPADPEPAIFSPEEIGLEGAAAQDALDATLLVDLEDPDGTLLQHWHFRLRGRRSTLAVRRVTETFLKRSGHYLLSFTDEEGGYSSVQFVKPRQEFQGTGDAGKEGAGAKTLVRLSKLTVTPGRPTAHDLSVLRSVAVTPHTSAAEAHTRQVDAFNVERVTRRFFETYRRLFRHVRDVIRAENPGARIGPYERSTTHDDPTLHAFTQRLLGRLLFLYFIQKKGWLSGQGDYITRLYEDTVAAPGGNFYRDGLEVLYFATLNTPQPRTGGLPGDIPYLNGSLFEREYPDTTVLNLPNRLFDPAWAGDGAEDPGGILHVLNNFNFTVGESAALEQDISLDPEMLGKVFENLMEEEEAAQSGTFYTPRSVVQFMAEETLTRFLADQTGLPQERLLPLTANDSEAHDLSTPEARALKDALADVRVLDPAVGTASMLVGMLSAMIRIRRSLEARILNTPIPEGSPAIAEWKREYIQHCLYGVDIKHEAIEIARLRLWLSLVVDAGEPEPLPNLDYKLMAGDGLLETVDGQPFIRAQRQMLGGQGDVTEKAAEIERLHDAFYREQHPGQRRHLRAEIQRLERELFRADVDDRISGLDAELTDLNRKLADPRQTDAARTRFRKRHAALSDNLQALLMQRRTVWDEQEPLPFFLHNVHFAEVMKDDNRGGNGGFDIVLGNPPYVRHERLGKEYKAALQTAFPEVGTGTADLYVYFFQKGLNLLRRGGRLAYITPNKFMRAGYGAKLRGHLASTTRLELLADFGDLPVFDATTYPLITLLQKGKPDGQPVQMLPERTLKAHLAEAIEGGVPAVREALSGFHEYARALTAPLAPNELTEREWTLDDPRVLRLMDKLRRAGTPLGELVEGKFYRGIVTGFNEAFVVDEAKRAELVAADPKSAEVIKPFLRGRDVRRWKAEWAGKYIIFTRRGIAIDKYPAIKRHLEAYRTRLEPGRPGGRKAGSYEWYEIQDNIAYFEEFTGRKIIYPDISQTPRFCLDVSNSYPDCTLFVIPVNGKEFLLSVLSSRAVEFFMTQIMPSVMGGSYRFKSIYMSQLPIPTPTPAQAARLEGFTDDSRLDELNALVYELYGLTPAEIQLVESLTAGAYAGAGEVAVGEGEEE
ncbi:hypothetical protein F8S09_10845 [Deinococcus sp. SDU3-2]|uniref:site-specific DNA-methyltransferase (adenine-specific) n=1 Tax=Deinococcus terrestris TaxID=2651870 RepID=A0A7X1NWN2_9DEIO|nr:TaqI-like C-terminal specificity domain-containing protein [Deinococcus terrestris]MPY67185.1 hypothetical protein [Deinococcus terrestris]